MMILILTILIITTIKINCWNHSSKIHIFLIKIHSSSWLVIEINLNNLFIMFITIKTLTVTRYSFKTMNNKIRKEVLFIHQLIFTMETRCTHSDRQLEKLIVDKAISSPIKKAYLEIWYHQILHLRNSWTQLFWKAIVKEVKYSVKNIWISQKLQDL